MIFKTLLCREIHLFLSPIQAISLFSLHFSFFNPAPFLPQILSFLPIFSFSRSEILLEHFIGLCVNTQRLPWLELERNLFQSGAGILGRLTIDRNTETPTLLGRHLSKSLQFGVRLGYILPTYLSSSEVEKVEI